MEGLSQVLGLERALSCKYVCHWYGPCGGRELPTFGPTHLTGKTSVGRCFVMLRPDACVNATVIRTNGSDSTRFALKYGEVR